MENTVVGLLWKILNWVVVEDSELQVKEMASAHFRVLDDLLVGFLVLPNLAEQPGACIKIGRAHV